MDQHTPISESADKRDDASPLRLWLRLFATANMVEAELSRRLRAEFSMTLPRFDLMAQLAKSPEPLALGELSRRLMVTNGNVTGLVDRLVHDGLVERRTAHNDRRSALVELTDEGRLLFDVMAAAHRGWVDELFDGLGTADRALLSRLLRDARGSVSTVLAGDKVPG
ncbi:MarR family transcriptional regulator [Acuticoccus sp. M5D2P5]|uniref:MarR family winged helix-turn-helix transcriptional regulator n=1 Tax=Acuticoccus kalidii TaxID=2910977 RepID=UPI001F206A0B|nr:MarR family transcriptional regulator [Acuticoccus kalidii]MCF3932986.1 MarR family transcriptional regulator [Acuticoccus kalidii]